MNWLRKYRFIVYDANVKSEYDFGWVYPHMNHLCGRNLSEFVYSYKLTEKEFIDSHSLTDGKVCLYLDGEYYISFDMVEIDKKESRKIKLNKLNEIHM